MTRCRISRRTCCCGKSKVLSLSHLWVCLQIDDSCSPSACSHPRSYLAPHTSSLPLSPARRTRLPSTKCSLARRFRLGAGPQQIHISFERNPLPSVHKSSRHPCFALPDPQALVALQHKIYEHHVNGGEAAAMECDKPGGDNSGSKVCNQET